jgi:hypothetical protein
MSKRKEFKEWQEESDILYNFEFEILEEPKNANTKVKIKHIKCGNVLNCSPNNHLKRYCKYCSKKHKRNIKEWQHLSDEIHNHEFEILEEPNSGKEKVNILHKKCGNILKMTLNNHINHKNGCRICSKYSLKDNQHWLFKSYELWGDDYSISEEVNNVHKKVKILHNICGKEHLKNMKSFIHGKRGCPYCYKDIRYSERYIADYLKSKFIKFEQEKTFYNLINPKTGRKLRYDFYLPDYNLVIETHGAQHYKPIEHWGGKEEFNEQIYRDNLKITYLKEKNINLIIINNKNLTKIREIL